MSTVRANNILDAAGGNTATINGMTPTGLSLQGFRNRIINGSMVIDQRRDGASLTVPQFGGYTLDRWNTNATQGSRFSVQRNAGSVAPPAGFTNYLGVTSLSAYSVLASDFFSVLQSVEGFNVADLGWGAAGAQSVTLSFWVRSSLTGTFGGSLNNSNFTRAYPFSYTISAANTWEQKTITVPGDTTGTWLTNNSTGVHVYFNLGAGSSFSGTSGAWAASGALAPTGAVSVVGTNGATFYITGVQLEAGTVVTPFERVDYGTSLMRCERYGQPFGGAGAAASASTIDIVALFRTPMRAAPTISVLAGTNGCVSLNRPTSNVTSINSVWNSGNSNTAGLRLNSSDTGMTTGATAWIYGGVLFASAEL